MRVFYLRENGPEITGKFFCQAFPAFYSNLPYLSPEDLISEVTDSASFDMEGYYINRYICHEREAGHT